MGERGETSKDRRERREIGRLHVIALSFAFSQKNVGNKKGHQGSKLVPQDEGFRGKGVGFAIGMGCGMGYRLLYLVISTLSIIMT